MKVSKERFDVIIVGAGMGGMTTASLLANDGFSVLVLEAAHVPGGCSSSYKRKGYIFESGATTLIGFDKNQPLRLLEDKLSIRLPKKPINPSMTVHMNGKKIIRWQDRSKWVIEAIRHFGEQKEQETFWNLSFQVSDIVWKVSAKNNFLPPVNINDWLQLFKNDLNDIWVLPYTLKSVKDVARYIGISNPEFYQFLDEQLLISAQSVADATPFLFGAPAITYTNYTNYYVPGGLVKMVWELEKFIKQSGGYLHTKEKVLNIERVGKEFWVRTSKGKAYRADTVISNIPIWNMPDITQGEISDYFTKESDSYSEAWGAFTMGIVTDDPFPEEMSLHHQLHLEDSESIPGIESGSIFISLSHRDDNTRAPEGERILNISAHAKPEFWFRLNGEYDSIKKHV